MADPRDDARTDEAMPATVVLVHGAFHGRWCWDRVVPRLEARGVPTIAIDLPGHGDDPADPGDFHAHADHLRSVLASVGRPTVVVGHSYGGAVITDGAADVPSVVRLVYLAAVVPDAGETISITRSDGGDADEPVSEVLAAMRTDDDGYVIVDPELAVSAFYADCDPADVEFALARLGRQNPAGFAQVVRAAAWRSVPSTYVVCTADRAVPVGVQRWLAERTTDCVELPTSHSPFFSAPDALADLLAGIARDSVGAADAPAS